MSGASHQNLSNRTRERLCSEKEEEEDVDTQIGVDPPDLLGWVGGGGWDCLSINALRLLCLEPTIYF